jgi:hypothetical protein
MAVLIRRLPVVFQVEAQRNEPQTEETKPIIVEKLLFNWVKLLNEVQFIMTSDI